MNTLNVEHGLVGRPIMEYVRELEGKVYMLRADQRRWHWISFLIGFGSGVIGMWLALMAR
jgi:hypothetical protein